MSQDNLTPLYHRTLSPYLLLEPGVQRQAGEPQEAQGIHKEEGTRGFLPPF